MQTYLQSARLNWYEIPREVAKLVKTLEDKANDPVIPQSSYFGQLQKFLDIASMSAGARFTLRSFADFGVEAFTNSFIRPVIKDLINEINVAFDVPQHLTGFVALDPEELPRDATLLEAYGTEEIEKLSLYYGAPSVTANGAKSFPPQIDGTALVVQYSIFKKFVFAKRVKFECKQQSALALAEQKLVELKKQLELLGSFYSKTKADKKKQTIKSIETEIVALKKDQVFTFDIMLKNWMSHPAASQHTTITRILNFAALIPPSTAEVERSFSLMNLISTPLRKRLSQESLGHCMRICKFPRELTDADYKEIMRRWLKADDTKSKQRRVAQRLNPL